MKMKELREKTQDEVIQKLADLQEEYFNLRFRKARNSLENSNAIRFVKKDIARVKTLLRERELRG